MGYLESKSVIKVNLALPIGCVSVALNQLETQHRIPTYKKILTRHSPLMLDATHLKINHTKYLALYLQTWSGKKLQDWSLDASSLIEILPSIPEALGSILNTIQPPPPHTYIP